MKPAWGYPGSCAQGGLTLGPERGELGAKKSIVMAYPTSSGQAFTVVSIL
jgi:hypothetical protein